MSDCGNKSMFDNKPLEMPRMWTEAFRSFCHERDEDG